jgi:hypothetical protein
MPSAGGGCCTHALTPPALSGTLLHPNTHTTPIPHHTNTLQLWSKIGTKGGAAHVPCFNSLFCVDCEDGDWLAPQPLQNPPAPPCASYESKSTCTEDQVSGLQV